MRVTKAVAVFALTVFCPVAGATFYTYSFGDLASCKYEIIGSERQEDSNIYMQWDAKAKTLNLGLESWEDKWGPFYTSDKTTDFAQVGLCRTVYTRKGSPVAFECHSESYRGFPLAGAKFNLHAYNGRATYRCVKGCGAGVPRLIYDNGYEETGNLDLDKFLEKFERVCKKSK